MFPVLITYFIPDQGIKSKLLDFYSDDYEDSNAITKQLLRTLEDNSLPVSSITSYSADNASVNYGNKKSVFQKLKDKVPGLVKANCFCHVPHNAGKYAFKNIDPQFDVETLVSKVYAQFKRNTVFKYEELERVLRLFFNGICHSSGPHTNTLAKLSQMCRSCDQSLAGS